MNFYQGKIYIINLARRSDRRAKMTAEINGISPYNYEFFKAIEGGAKGCLQSHLAVIKLAKENDLPYVIILEDDCEFTDRFEHKLSVALRQLPDNWDMLYFGANNKKPLWMVSDNIGKCIHTLTTSSYAVKSTIYDKIIDQLSAHPDRPVDEIYRTLVHPSVNAYGVKPTLIYQAGGFSDVEGMETNYKWQFDNPQWT